MFFKTRFLAFFGGGGQAKIPGGGAGLSNSGLTTETWFHARPRPRLGHQSRPRLLTETSKMDQKMTFFWSFLQKHFGFFALSRVNNRSARSAENF